MKPIIVNDNRMSEPEKKHDNMLSILKSAGEIIDYIYEPFRLILTKKTTYTPDFFVIYPNHFEIHEVKGSMKEKKKGKWTGRYVPFCRGDESLTKLKICARMFPWWKFQLYWYFGNNFDVREINS